VLGTALTVALLYFALMELLLLDSMRSFNEAQRFRSRTVAATVAENGAELAAESITTRLVSNPELESPQGDCSAEMNRNEDTFEITAKGKSKGVASTSADLYLKGTVQAGKIHIDWARYSQ
jgi:hypothetical protein